MEIEYDARKKYSVFWWRATETAADERTTRKLRENWRRCTHAGSSHRRRSIRNCTGNITQRPSPASIIHTLRPPWPQPQSLIKPASDHPPWYIALWIVMYTKRYYNYYCCIGALPTFILTPSLIMVVINSDMLNITWYTWTGQQRFRSNTR